jgi:hypothetical protein
MITPSDSASSPENYAAVSPHGQGTAPYNVQAGNDEAAISAEYDAAGAVSGAGIVYPRGPRQAQAEALISSPQGFAVGGYDIDAGSADRWPANVEPGD